MGGVVPIVRVGADLALPVDTGASGRNHRGIKASVAAGCNHAGRSDVPGMDEIDTRKQPVPAEWLEIIAESEADLVVE